MQGVEQILASQMTKWLRDEGWEVWEEMQPVSGGPICDIVARRTGIVWAIEVKSSLGFRVLAQACRWRGMVHQVSCATRAVKSQSDELYLKQQTCESLGIGWDEVNLVGKVRHQVQPVERQVDVVWKFDPQKNRRGIAGTKGDYRRYTPFKATCHKLLGHVMEFPGTQIRYAVKEIDHHYKSDKSARSALLRAVDDKIVPGIIATVEAGITYLYPTQEAQEIYDAVESITPTGGEDQDR